MEIRHARAEELPRLMELYDVARKFMRSRGNTAQWTGGYPSRELISAGIELSQQYVCTDDLTPRDAFQKKKFEYT